jgi:hypothetical protein
VTVASHRMLRHASSPSARSSTAVLRLDRRHRPLRAVQPQCQPRRQVQEPGLAAHQPSPAARQTSELSPSGQDRSNPVGGRGVYRKTHLLPGEKVFTAGGEYPVFEVNRLRYGISICHDARFAGAAARIAAQGARVLLVPAQNMMKRQAAETWKHKHH